MRSCSETTLKVTVWLWLLLRFRLLCAAARSQRLLCTAARGQRLLCAAARGQRLLCTAARGQRSPSPITIFQNEKSWPNPDICWTQPTCLHRSIAACSHVLIAPRARSLKVPSTPRLLPATPLTLPCLGCRPALPGLRDDAHRKMPGVSAQPRCGWYSLASTIALARRQRPPRVRALALLVH